MSHPLPRVSKLRLLALATTALSLSTAACGSEVDTDLAGHGSPSKDLPRATTATPSPATDGRSLGANLPANIPAGLGHTFAVGGSHSCIVLAGAVKCWGYNYYGQLGLGDTMNRGDKPHDMGIALSVVDLGGRAAVSIAAGESHTCAILDDGSVACWGENMSGQLGRGDAVTSWGGSPGQMGASLGRVNLGAGVIAKALSLGTNHSCALLSDDTVKCWGDNSHGQLGIGSTSSRGKFLTDMGDALERVSLGSGRHAKALATGGLHTCAILDNDTLKCWGDNRHGQLGLGDTIDRGTSPLNVGDGLPPVSLGLAVTKVLEVAASSYGTCARLQMGGGTQLKCWGDNALGQLGAGDTNDRGNTPGSTGDGLAPVNLGAGVSPVQIAMGWDHTCALLDTGEAKCWGSNGVGQLGLGDTIDRGSLPNQMGDSLPRLSFGGAAQVTQIGIGISHSCARFDDGKVKCWGYNAAGQLGLESFSDVGDEPGETASTFATADLGQGGPLN